MLARLLKRVARKPTPARERPELVGSMLWAAEWGQGQTVIELLDKGAPVNARNDEDMTALHYLVMKSDYDAVRAVVERGAQINAITRDGVTPLHLAATNSDARIVELLCAHGAQTDLQNRNGQTALHMAHRGSVARALIRAGINTTLKDKTGLTALGAANKNGRRELEAAILNAISLRKTEALKRVVQTKNRRAA